MRKRLGEMGDPFLAGTTGAVDPGPDNRVSPRLLRTVAELHRLHPTVMRVLGRQAKIESEVLDAHSELARVRGDLIGSGRGR